MYHLALSAAALHWLFHLRPRNLPQLLLKTLLVVLAAETAGDGFEIVAPESSVLCIDPPYFHKGSSLYTSFYMRSDHENVADHILICKRHGYSPTISVMKYTTSTPTADSTSLR
jgi:hypothetical protein